MKAKAKDAAAAEAEPPPPPPVEAAVRAYVGALQQLLQVRRGPGAEPWAQLCRRVAVAEQRADASLLLRMPMAIAATAATPFHLLFPCSARRRC